MNRLRIELAAALLVSCALVSCNRDNLVSNGSKTGHGQVGVTLSDIKGITTKSTADEEKIGTGIIRDIDGEDIQIETFVSDYNELPFGAEMQTKGGIVLPDSVNTDGNSFYVNAWLGKQNRYPNSIPTYVEGGSTGRVNFDGDETNHRFINNGKASYDGTVWTLADGSGDPFIWRNNVSTTFWSYYPSSIGSTVTWPADLAEDGYDNTTDTQKTLSFTHTVADSALYQNDILFAYNRQYAKFEISPFNTDYGKLVDGSDEVSIKFYHALAAVRFDVAGLKLKKCTIKEVFFEGAKFSGTCTVTGSDNVPSFSWGSLSAGKTSVAQGFANGDFTQKGLDGQTADALQDPGSMKYFFMIPQDVKGKEVKIGIKYIDHLGEAQSRTFVLDHDVWEAGKLYTYKLSPADIVDVVVSDIVNDNVKESVKITNTGNVKEFMRVAIVGFWGVDDSTDGSIVINLPWQFDYSDPAFEGWNTTDWTYNSTDGFFYSKTAVDPAVSKVLFTKYTAPVGPDGAKLYIDIVAQAVAAGTATSWAGATGN